MRLTIMTNCHGGISSSSILKCYFCDCLDLFVLQERRNLLFPFPPTCCLGAFAFCPKGTRSLELTFESVNFSSLYCTGEIMEWLGLNTVALYHYSLDYIPVRVIWGYTAPVHMVIRCNQLENCHETEVFGNSKVVKNGIE